MRKLLRHFDKDIFYFLPLILFSVSVLADTTATARAGKYSDNDYLKLRGEIWYGNASWYGKKFHGRKTSNGEKYNRKKLTAAHKELPFNTKVLVTNLKNNKSVVVRINDRGPFVGGRIIDLSEEAAERLDIKSNGVGYIKLQVLTPISQTES